MNLILSAILFAAPAFAQVNPATPAMSDGQIAEVIQEANEAEVDTSKKAKSHARSKAVQDYAKQMIQHHEQANKDAKKAFLQPQDQG